MSVNENSITMRSIPTLNTLRLILRPFELADGPRVQTLAGAWEIANTTATMPHPYPDGVAEQWIAGHAEGFAKGNNLPLAVCLQDGTLIGCVSLMGFRTSHSRGELGYWIGKDYWGKGYCTEAARELVRFGFAELALNRIFGQHMSRNPASGRVMQKIGMKHEGCLRQHLSRWGKLEDLEHYGLLRCEWLAAQACGMRT